MDQPWPRLLACWDGRRLRSLLLHGDGRRSHARDEAVGDATQLAPALADALASLHRPVRHLALVSAAPLATDALRGRLGLATLCELPPDRARRLADGDCWAGAARALDLALHTPAASSACARIRAAYAQLTRCERRVADVVLADPAAALETATARLAAAAQVSQPQVIRFCRAAGFDGVASLKRALAASLAGDGAAPPGHPLLARSLQALGQLDRACFAAAARRLAEAPRIDVLADAARTPLLDLALRGLWRLGLAARPVAPGEPPTAPACLSLGTGAPAADVRIAEAAVAGDAGLQLVTGPEADAAPTLLATLALQLLLAELAPACGFRAETAPG